jgi:hypothetical protein
MICADRLLELPSWSFPPVCPWFSEGAMEVPFPSICKWFPDAVMKVPTALDKAAVPTATYESLLTGPQSYVRLHKSGIVVGSIDHRDFSVSSR